MNPIIRLAGMLVLLVIIVSCNQSANNSELTTGAEQDRYVKMKDSGVNIHYKVIGKGPVDVVFIPGWTNPLTVYQKQFEYFKDKARCIYIDLPGHGQSDAPNEIDYTMEFMADAIHTVLKKEKVEKFIAVGFSMGPVPLSQLHLKYPGMITKLINLDGKFLPWPAESPEREQFIAWREDFHNQMLNWDQATKKQLGSSMILESSPEDLKEWGAYFLNYPNWLLSNIWYNFTDEHIGKPVDWSVPILCIFTQEPDSLMVNTFFPGAEIHVFEDSGHVVQWEKAGEVNVLMNDFIFDN